HRFQRSRPEGLCDARLRLAVAKVEQRARAAALLGPATPGRHGRMISFFAARRGAGPSPELVSRLLRRLDREGIAGQLELVGSDVSAAAAVRAEQSSFVSVWEAELAALPDDWSDLYIEAELTSSDYLERAALLLAPMNPARYGGKPGFRCRV